ncbi:CPBP family intramembrane glutamic endopeptidase [Undibacterium sp. Ji67W]|uniref:CPBP family intramembrane glutamic endopeptidase n=1 Tax=Undibacterium sp. Ji67W TaxID=3413042 RepID=UPI003BF0215D
MSAYLFVATALSVLFIYRAAVWIVLLVLTMSCAYIENLITFPGVVCIAAMAGLIAAKKYNGTNLIAKRILNVVLGALGLIMALHLLPGFNNLALIKNTQISANGTLFSQYVNLDKGIAGVFMIAAFCRSMPFLRDKRWKDMNAWLIVVVTFFLTFSIAILMGVTHWQPQWTSYTVTFLFINLFFTCIAEEAFFRGGIQQGIIQLYPKLPWLAIGISALLFGLSHLGGGVKYAVLATIAGLGYACLYQRSRSILSVILMHFAFNGLHFVFFVYPAIA